MKELENEFLEEITVKIEGYFEYVDKNAENESNNTQAEKLKQKMEQEKRNEIKGIIDSYRQKMEQDIEEKRQVLAEKMQESLEFVKNIREEIKKVNAVAKVAKEMKYTAGNDFAKKQIQSIKQRCKEYSAKLDEYSSMEEEFDEAKKELESFDSIFANINFNSEQGIYDLRDIVEKAKTVEELGHDENEGETAIPKLSEEDVEVEKPTKILTMEDIKDEEIRKAEEEIWKQEEARKEKERKRNEKAIKGILEKGEAKREQDKKLYELKGILEKQFKEIEKGYEDLIRKGYLESYVEAKYNALRQQDIEKLQRVLESMKGKTLLDIYKEQRNHFEKDTPERKRLENIIKKLEERKAELDKQAQQPKPEQPKPGQPKQGQPKPGQPKPGQPKPGQPNPGQPKPGQPTIAENKEISFVVDVAKGCIYLEGEEIDGNKIRYVLRDRMEDAIAYGKQIKKDMIKQNKAYKSEIKKMDPALLGTIKMLVDKAKDNRNAQYHQEQLLKIMQEYKQSFMHPSHKTSIQYIFGSQNEINDKDKTVKELKKSAQKAEKLGIAEIEGLEPKKPRRGLMGWFEKIKTRRLEARETKEIRESLKRSGISAEALDRQVHFIKNPALKKDMAMGRVGLNEERAEKMYEKMQEEKRKGSREKLGMEHIDIDHEQAKEQAEGKATTEKEPMQIGNE